MLNLNKKTIEVKTVPNVSSDSVRIKAGSFVIDNKWINFNGTLFKINDYITKAVQSPRTRFFKNRNNAVFLLIGIDADEGLKVIEGQHVKFSTIQAVPPPEVYNILPLIGLVLIQDGTRDLNFGYKPLSEPNIISFSGSGNIIDKNKQGETGAISPMLGDTGLAGETGTIGDLGPTGIIGATGQRGHTKEPAQGVTGLKGPTGINWDVNIPFQDYF
ncbi:MAG: collagen-like protein [Dehalococcoidia bacterium]|nr:MAG: collagen-like protein [Dehalococcoidia bacterium]